MKTKAQLIADADAWAHEVWDESELPDDEKSDAGLVSLSKACGSLGYSCGYKAGYSAALQELEQREREAFEAGRETIQGEAVSGRIATEILNDPWEYETYDDYKNRRGSK